MLREIRVLVGLPLLACSLAWADLPESNPGKIVVQGGNVVAPPGDTVISSGGTAVVVPPGSSIVYSGGNAVIAPPGSSIITDNGRSIVASAGTNAKINDHEAAVTGRAPVVEPEQFPEPRVPVEEPLVLTPGTYSCAAKGYDDSIDYELRFSALQNHSYFMLAPELLGFAQNRNLNCHIEAIKEKRYTVCGEAKPRLLSREGTHSEYSADDYVVVDGPDRFHTTPQEVCDFDDPDYVIENCELRVPGQGN